MKIRVLVTGVGGVIGQGIIRSVRMSGLNCQIIVADANPLSAGFYMGDEKLVIPYASESGFADEIFEVCKEKSVDIILPGIYQDVSVLSGMARHFEENIGTRVVACNKEALDCAEDKWSTFNFLKCNGLNFSPTIKGEDIDNLEEFIEESGYPVVLKKRRGHGSKGLLIVRDRAELDFLLPRHKDVILQKYLYPDEEEYTCGVFAGPGGEIWDTMAMKRELSCGMTYKGEVSSNNDVKNEAENAVRMLKATGPCNVQLRMTPHGPVIFEINARFSSSTSIRARFGFNEARMAVESYLCKAPPAKQAINEGIALRYWDEIVLPRTHENS